MSVRASIGLPLAVAALLAVGAAAWYAAGAAVPAPLPIRPGADSRAPAATAAAASPTDAVAAGSPAITRDEVAVAPGADPATASAPCVLRVVDEADRPLPGAEVGVHVEHSTDDYVHIDIRERDAWAGDLHVADGDGEVRIPRVVGDSVTVFGRTAERWGVAYFPSAALQQPGGEPLVLRLRPDLTVRAQVLDDRNLPVVGVRVRLADDEGITEQVGGALQRSEAPDGVATFRHAQQYVDERWRGDGVVALDCPTDPLVFAPVRFDALPGEPIPLRLPATGAVVLTLVDEGGRRVDDMPDELSVQLDVEIEGRVRKHWLSFFGGELRLQPVGLGLRLGVHIDEPEVSGSIEVAGPTQPFEVVERPFPVVRHPTVSGRLVDRAGAAQQGYWHATFVHEASGIYRVYFETGGDGRFVVGVPGSGGDVPHSVWFHRTLPDPEHHAFRRLSDLHLHAGRNEIGDVVLEPLPLLVAGVVVDETGEPVAGAELEILQGTPDDANALPGVERPAAVSAADGSFRVAGHHSRPDLMVLARRAGSNSEPVPFVVGDPPVTVVLPRVGAARMPITLRGGLTAQDLVFEYREVATGRGRMAVERYVWRDGAAEWSGLRPGRYEFSVGLLGAAAPLVTVAGAVAPDTTVALPAQELGDGVQRIAVTVCGDDGAAVETAYVVVDPEGPTGPGRIALVARSGRVELHKGAPPVDLLVIAPGHRQELVRGVTADTTVRLSRGIDVEVTVTTPAGFLGNGDKLVPNVRRYDAGDPDARVWDGPRDLYIGDAGRAYYPARSSWLWNPRSLTVREGRFSITVPGPGDYAVEWSVDGAWTFRELPAAARRVFSVAETTERVHVALELTAADVR